MAVYAENQIKLTYEDYRLLPDDGKRHEIIDGKHYVSPSPNTNHQRVSVLLVNQLVNSIDASGTGIVIEAPMDVELNDVSIVQPDIIVVAGSRREIIAPSRIIGVPEYWIVYPDARIVRRYTLSGKYYDEGVVYDKSIEYSAGDMHVTIDLSEVWRRAEV